MEAQKVRIIHVKTGKTREVMPHIAADTKMLFDHGWMVQDLKVKEAKATLTTNNQTVKVIDYTPIPEVLDLLQELPKQEKSKPGRKQKTV